MLCNSPSVKNRRHSRRVRAPLLRQLLRSRHEHLHGLPPTHSSGSSSADDISSGRTSSSERSEGYQTIAREVNAIEQQRGNAVIEKEKAKARLEKAKARLEWEMARMREENARRLEWEMARVKEEKARILSLQSEYENYSISLERLEDLLKEKRTEQRSYYVRPPRKHMRREADLAPGLPDEWHGHADAENEGELKLPAMQPLPALKRHRAGDDTGAYRRPVAASSAVAAASAASASFAAAVSASAASAAAATAAPFTGNVALDSATGVAIRDRFAVSDAVTEPPRPAHTRTASTDSSAAAESASQLTFVSDEKEAESSA